MIKYKVCKIGKGKASGFIGCQTKRNVSKYSKSNFRYGLGIDCGCFSKWLLSSDEGKKILSKTINKLQQPKIELEKAFEERKINKSLSYLLVNVRNICHEYIRLRDKGKNCISCDEKWNDNHQAGHLYKAELFSTIKFDELNINNQCVGCNIYKDGNESGYRVGFINRYSKGILSLLDSKALLDKKNSHKWDREMLEEKRRYYSLKIKKIKNAK